MRSRCCIVFMHRVAVLTAQGCESLAHTDVTKRLQATLRSSLITDLFNKLLAEFSSEATHKSYCDQETSKANQMREDVGDRCCEAPFPILASRRQVHHAGVREFDAFFGAGCSDKEAVTD